MVEWSSITTVALDILKDYWMAIGIGVILVVYVIYRKLKNRKGNKKDKEEPKKEEPVKVEEKKDEVVEQPTEPEPEAEPEPKVEPEVEEPKEENPFVSMFQEDVFGEKKVKEDIAKGIKTLTINMHKESQDIDQDMNNDFEGMRNQLKDVHNKKEEIRAYGLELAKLFEKYRQREFYLTAMMQGMEQMMKAKDKLN